MIRKYAENDLHDLLEAWYSASQVGHPFLDEEFFASERIAIATVYVPNAETWVFERDGHVVGFIALSGDEVGGLFVDANYHGQGIGRALMDHAAGIRDCLALDVFEKNHVGRRFYEKYGFVQVGEYLHEETGLMMLRLELNCE
jgi:putative acetyltransferase